MDKLVKFEEFIRATYTPNKSYVTVHDIHLLGPAVSKGNMLHYTTSVKGQINTINTEIDEDNKVMNLTITIKLIPFSHTIRNHLPYFKDMQQDPEHLNRTIFKDKDDNICAIISMEFNSREKQKLRIKGLYDGIKCKDNCLKKCEKHRMNIPYSYLK